jgi:RNA polymerase sigma-70 factor, ECF subfamily
MASSGLANDVATFLSGLSEPQRSEAPPESRLSEFLERALAAPEAAWKLMPPLRAQYLSHLARVAGEWPSLAAFVDHAPVEDLHLAFACACGLPAAMAMFERRHFFLVDVALRNQALAGAGAQDLQQELRTRLFVASSGRNARVLEFAGRSSLRSWVRAVIFRHVLNAVQRSPKDVPVRSGEASAIDSGAVHRNPESDYLRERYQGDFQATFSRVLVTRSAEEKRLLRERFENRRSLQEIADLLGVDRATVVRRLARALKGILATVRDELRRNLSLSPSELSSALRQMRSEFDVTFRDLQSGDKKP